jgi:hypothetical protein
MPRDRAQNEAHVNNIRTQLTRLNFVDTQIVMVGDKLQITVESAADVAKLLAALSR